MAESVWIVSSAYFYIHMNWGCLMSNMPQIPFWQRYTMSVEEASQYFRIGENKLRRIISENKDADFLLWNGNRPQIKRILFEKYIDRCEGPFVK